MYPFKAPGSMQTTGLECRIRRELTPCDTGSEVPTMAVEIPAPQPAAETPKRSKFIRMPMEDDLPPGPNGLPEGVRLPTEDDLPYSDGEPMESWRHVEQMHLLMEPLRLAWADRDDFFVGGNMFVYFSEEQLRNRHFRGPDVFVVLGVPHRERKSWVVWQEGRVPDVVIELLSRTTADVDRGEKKLVYQNELRVPGYFYYDPWSGELAGFQLQNGVYLPVEADGEGRLPCHPLGLALVRWRGSYQGVEADWLRWAYPDGRLLPTPGEAGAEQARLERERAEVERQRADAERERAEAERERAERLAAKLRELGIEP